MGYGKMIKIIYEDNHLLVVEKPVNMLVQEDETKDKSLLTELKEYLKEKYHKPGNVYLGLVHRLDRPVGGVMVFAKTSKCASRLSKQFQGNKIIKEYLAIVNGNITDSGKFVDYLKKDTKNNLVTISKDGKKAILNYQKVKYLNNYSLVHIFLETGRPHQIRVQFSSRGYPLYGDHRYNKNVEKDSQIALWSYKLTLYHPITKEKMTFISTPPDKYPWKNFNKIITK